MTIKREGRKNSFYLSAAYSGDIQQCSISEDNFKEIKAARNCLSSALSIEQKYNILIESYIELEELLLKNSIREMIQFKTGYERVFHTLNKFNTKVLCLFSTIKLYQDSVFRHARDIVVDKYGLKEYINGLFQKEYDNNMEYRLMDLLRNYSQHYDLPVQLLNFNTSLDENGEDNFVAFQMKISSFKDRLINHDYISKKEGGRIVQEMPEKLDLIHYFRVYIACLSNIHEAVRDLIDDKVKEARGLIETCINKYRNIDNKKLLGLYAIHERDGVIYEQLTIMTEWDDIRINLTKLNKQLRNLPKRYITNKLDILTEG